MKVGTADATIVGVMPERFGFPVNQNLWLPLRADGSLLAPRTGPPVTMFGRLAPGVSLRQAEAELDGIAAGLAATNREAYKNLQPRVVAYGTPPLEGDTRVIKDVLYAANTFFLLCSWSSAPTSRRSSLRAPPHAGGKSPCGTPSAPAAAASSRNCSRRRSC